jgi:hypothetical protein
LDNKIYFTIFLHFFSNVFLDKNLNNNGPLVYFIYENGEYLNGVTCF